MLRFCSVCQRALFLPLRLERDIAVGHIDCLQDPVFTDLRFTLYDKAYSPVSRVLGLIFVIICQPRIRCCILSHNSCMIASLLLYDKCVANAKVSHEKIKSITKNPSYLEYLSYSLPNIRRPAFTETNVSLKCCTGKE